MGTSSMSFPKNIAVGTPWEALVPALMLAAAVVVLGVVLLRSGEWAGVEGQQAIPGETAAPATYPSAVRTIRFVEPAEKTGRLVLAAEVPDQPGETSGPEVSPRVKNLPKSLPQSAPENFARVNKHVARRANAQKNTDPVCGYRGRIWTSRRGWRSWRCRR
jgi:hypothetical protein